MSPETPLERIEDLPDAARQKLKARWITSVEQLVAQAATPQGKAHLAALLDADAAAVKGLLARAKALLRPDLVAQLEQETPQDHGLGALRPPVLEQPEHDDHDESEPPDDPGRILTDE